MRPTRKAAKAEWNDYVEMRVPGANDYREALGRVSRDAFVAKDLKADIDDVVALHSRLDAVESLNEALKELYVCFDDGDANTIVDEVVKRHYTETARDDSDE